MKLIVSMTSWPKRICNVATVVKSLLDQEVEPDIIQINLSKEEFPNREDDFPDDLKELIKTESRIDIEWVDGNNGVFKKIIPTLKKHYGEKYYLFSVDDDYIYRHDYIKMMIDFLNGGETDSFCLNHPGIIGNRMVYKSSIFSSDFWEKLTPEVVATRIDDLYITHYMNCKSKKMGGCRPKDTPEIMRVFNSIYPNSHNTATGQYSGEDIRKAREIISKIIFDR